MEIITKNIEFIDETNEENASVSLNPTFRRCKFILTDDQPNLNNVRVPESEFDNLIRTGIYAPIKMAAGEIKPGHNEAIPIGVITALRKENNYVEGLASLWSEERPDDVAFIKKSYDDGKPLQLSWEILFAEKVPEENNIFALKDTALRATTLVGMPAYAGRTPILAVASQDEQIISEESNLDELEQLKLKVQELTDALAAKETELAQVIADKEELAQFKATAEKEQADAAKLDTIKTKFVEAKIEKSAEYFTDNKDMLLSLSETALDFMVQELVSFASTVRTETSSTSLPHLPATSTKSDPKELGRKLRNSK